MLMVLLLSSGSIRLPFPSTAMSYGTATFHGTVQIGGLFCEFWLGYPHIVELEFVLTYNPRRFSALRTGRPLDAAPDAIAGAEASGNDLSAEQLVVSVIAATAYKVVEIKRMASLLLKAQTLRHIKVSARLRQI
jgi:hypothetical protein